MKAILKNKFQTTTEIHVGTAIRNQYLSICILSGFLILKSYLTFSVLFATDAIIYVLKLNVLRTSFGIEYIIAFQNSMFLLSPVSKIIFYMQFVSTNFKTYLTLSNGRIYRLIASSFCLECLRES